jgi:hypothetical protein
MLNSTRLDKIAVTANHYFEFGHPPDRVYFGKLWRGNPDKATGVRPLAEKVEKVIRGGVSALYGLVELAEDYDSSAGSLRSDLGRLLNDWREKRRGATRDAHVRLVYGTTALASVAVLACCLLVYTLYPTARVCENSCPFRGARPEAAHDC